MTDTAELVEAIRKKAVILTRSSQIKFNLSKIEREDLIQDCISYAAQKIGNYDFNKGVKPETYFGKVIKHFLDDWADGKCKYGRAYTKVKAKKVSRLSGSGRAYWLSLSMDSFLADFSPRCQRVARLYMAGYDLEDMPEILGKSLSTIKRDWAHIKAMFKNKWKGQN